MPQRSPSVKSIAQKASTGARWWLLWQEEIGSNVAYCEHPKQQREGAVEPSIMSLASATKNPPRSPTAPHQIMMGTPKWLQELRGRCWTLLVPSVFARGAAGWMLRPHSGLQRACAFIELCHRWALSLVELQVKRHVSLQVSIDNDSLKM